MESSIEVREANLRIDRAALIDFLGRHLTSLSNDRRFDWLYHENPCGPGRAWIARENPTTAIVGVAAAFPRRFRVRGRRQEGWVLGDFCVDPQFRTLGPAVQLQRACLQMLSGNPTAVGYDFPSERMLAIYRRLQIAPSARLVRMAKLLRADKYVAETIRWRLAARTLSAASNLLLGWSNRDSQTTRRYAIGMESEFGPEFCPIIELATTGVGVCIDRAPEYLNWRYLRHPHRRHELMTARRNGVLVGYLVFSQGGDNASIADLLSPHPVDVLPDLLHEAARLLRQRGVMTLSVPILSSHPYRSLLEKAGFQAREACEVVILGALQAAENVGADLRSGWWLIEGDRDS